MESESKMFTCFTRKWNEKWKQRVLLTREVENEDKMKQHVWQKVNCAFWFRDADSGSKFG